MQYWAMAIQAQSNRPGNAIHDADIFHLSESAIVLRARQEYSVAAGQLEVQRRIWRLAEQLHSSALPCIDIVPGLHNITVVYDGPQQLAEQWRTVLEVGWQQSATDHGSTTASGRLIELKAYYGGEYGPDMSTVCEHCGLDENAVIELHSQASYTVAFIGFQPGFPYLLGLPERLNCPRKRKPAQQLAAGSIAIGGVQTGIYPGDSPGGWQVIGRLAEPGVLFQHERDEPVLLRAADQLRFIAQ